MAYSKELKKEYKGVEFTLNRNDCDFGPKWTVSNNEWTMGPYELKRHAVGAAHSAIDNI